MSQIDFVISPTDHYIRISNIRLSSDDSVPTVSSASAEILDSNGSTKSNSSISLSAVSGSSDAYEGTFPDTVSLTEGEEVQAKVTVQDSNSNKRTYLSDPVTVTNN